MNIIGLLPETSFFFVIQDNEKIHQAGIDALLRRFEKINPRKAFIFMLAHDEEIFSMAERSSEIVEAIALETGIEVIQIRIRLVGGDVVPEDVRLLQRLVLSESGVLVYVLTRKTRDSVYEALGAIPVNGGAFIFPETPAFAVGGEMFGLN